MSHLFIQLLVVVAACRLIGKVFVRFGLPAVVGEMSAGILLGPSLFGLLAPAAFAFVFPPESLGAVRLLSQVGICLFMFTVGMELNLAHVRNKATTAVAVSHDVTAWSIMALVVAIANATSVAASAFTVLLAGVFIVIMAVITTMMTGPLLTLLGVRQPKMESPEEPSAA